ncbi:MAG TPA: transcription termination/antitermination protein NusG [Gammaproteobacteria bacterium]|nr:transcription termination/antitermination protein NusG [Gammaproteobacteria bacterium]
MSNEDKIVNDSTFRWFVVRVSTGYEEKVKNTILLAVQQAKMTDGIGDCLVPTEEIIEMKAGVKRKTRRKFFPGYVLIQLDMNDDLWHLIRRLPNVLGFVGGTQDKPMPITNKEAKAILDRMMDATEGQSKPKISYELGEVVRVMDGPFSDFTGVIEDINYDKSRLVVSVLIFGRSTPVELEFNQVEKSS